MDKVFIPKEMVVIVKINNYLTFYLFSKSMFLRLESILNQVFIYIISQLKFHSFISNLFFK